MNPQNSDENYQELISVSKKDESLQIRQLMEASGIEFKETTDIASTCCAEARSWIENTTTFSVKTHDLKRAMVLSSSVIKNKKIRKPGGRLKNFPWIEKILYKLKLL